MTGNAKLRTGCAFLLLTGVAAFGGCAQYRPKLLASLPDECNTPDGMTLDEKTGDIILAAPNFNDDTYPGVLLKITPDNRVEPFFDKLPVHPKTKKVGPMGLDFGPDGNLYVADNQYFSDTDHASRLLRVVMKDGKPVKGEVVVEGLKLANAVVWKGETVYVSDTYFDLEDTPGASGVYKFSLKELRGRRPVKLKPKGRKDPHLVAQIRTVPLKHRHGELAGADGLTFDGDGNLYVGNFGDGALFRITFNEDGSTKDVTCVHRKPPLTCVDGIFWDAQRNVIFIADSEKNAVQVYDVATGKVSTLWENGDTNGADGLLDQPCEVLVRGDELIIVNFDMPFPGLKNTEYDAPHTVSVIDISKFRAKK